MKRLARPLLIAVLAAAAFAEGRAYKTHSTADFSAQFPQDLPYKQVQRKEGWRGFIAGTLDSETKPGFAVLYFPKLHTNLEGLIDFARSKHPQLTEDKKVIVDGARGAQLSGAVDGLPLTVRVFPGRNGSYFVVGRSIDPPENQRFVESFHFTK